ncbi:MAG: hypothetical protein ABSA76_13085 [Bacteroidales bacterium]
MSRDSEVTFTGDNELDISHIIDCEFANFIVQIRVDNENKFKEIVAIKEKKQFYNFYSKEIKSRKDVQEFYFDK